MIELFVYKDRGSFWHRFDARFKILFTIIASVLIMMGRVRMLTIMSIVIVLLMLFTRSFSLTPLKGFLIIYGFILLMHYFFGSLFEGMLVIWRFCLLLFYAHLLLATTTIRSQIKAIEYFLKPFKSILSPRNVGLMISATIRFIPLLFSESKQISDAQKSRGSVGIAHITSLCRALLRNLNTRVLRVSDAIDSRGYHPS